MKSVDRVSLVVKALETTVTGDADRLEDVFADDVVGWAPNFCVSSLAQLAAELGDREDVLSDIGLSVEVTEVGLDRAVAEWVIHAVHTGPTLIDDDVLVEPTNAGVVVAGATFVEFHEGLVWRFRHYFDGAALLEQLLRGR